MTDTTDMAVGHRRSLTLGELLRIPARRWTTVLAFALLGVVATAGYLLLAPTTYQGTAVVVVRPVVADPFTYPGPGADRAVNMNVESGIATGGQVADAVAAATGARPDAVRAALTVELPVGTQLLRFDYTASSSDAAVRGANAAATAYLQVRRTMYADQQAELLASYDAEIKMTGAQETATRKTLPADLDPNAPTPPNVTATMERLRALNDQLTELAAQRARIAAIDLTPGTVSSLAEPPAPSSRDSAPLYLVVALLGGALLGAVLSYAQESFDRRVRSIVEAEEASGLPALAALRRRHRRQDRRRLQADLRYAAMAITERLAATPHRRVVLLSARPGEVDAALVADLASALAGEGQAVRVEGSLGDALGSRPSVLAAVTNRLRAAGVPRLLPRAAIADRAAPHPVVDEAGLPSVGVRPRPAPHPGPLQPKTPQPANASPATGRAAAPLLLEEEFGTSPGGQPPRPVPGASGRVRMRTAGGPEAGFLTLVTAPPAESDEHGVRVARDGAAVVVVARDLTRARELRRLADRLRITGTRPLGLLFLERS